MKNKILNTLLMSLFLLACISFVACNDDPDKFKPTSGTPEVYYVRLNNPNVADSLITHAYLNNTITLIGSNLKSVHKLLFNDQSAVLNTSFITDNALIVTIPNVIPSSVTNKMYMITNDNDTVAYDFAVDVPAPAITSMDCEYVAEGDTAVISGNYFIDDPNIPLSVIFPGNIKATKIVSVNINQIKVIVPSGTNEGTMSVTSLYGTGTSVLHFRDTRNIFLNFDDLTAASGWRSGKLSNVDGISGNYVHFAGSMPAKASELWDEDSFSFNYWPKAQEKESVPLYLGDLKTAVLKFECKVDQPWSSAALQIIFTTYDQSGINSYLGNASVPRALWIPWTASVAYKTNGWTTVTIPLSKFTKTPTGETCANALTRDMLRGLTMFVYSGGVDDIGTKCDIDMCIDNIRIVPGE